MSIPLGPDQAIDYMGGTEAFMKFLQENVNDAKIAAGIMNAALQGKGDKYSFSLQDTVNRVGELLGFEVKYGEYRRGPDGVWVSPDKSRSLVVETKTTTTYQIQLGSLLNYMSDLSKSKEIKQDTSLGLYVIGRSHEDTGELKDSIKGGGYQGKLRVITADGLLGLLELKEMSGLDHQGVLAFFPLDLVDAGKLITKVREIFFQEEAEKVQPEDINEPEEDHKIDISRLTGTIPEGYVFDGVYNNVSSWREVLKGLCEDISKKEQQNFSRVLEIEGRKRKLFSHNPEELRARSKKDINNTGIYYEVNLSAKSIVSTCLRILDLFGYPASSFEIKTQKPEE